MKDLTGNDVKVGDFVIFKNKTRYRSAFVDLGKIEKTTKHRMTITTYKNYGKLFINKHPNTTTIKINELFNTEDNIKKIKSYVKLEEDKLVIIKKPIKLDSNLIIKINEDEFADLYIRKYFTENRYSNLFDMPEYYLYFPLNIPDFGRIIYSPIYKVLIICWPVLVKSDTKLNASISYI